MTEKYGSKPLSHNCGCRIINFDRDILMCPIHTHAQQMKEAIDHILKMCERINLLLAARGNQ